MCPDTLLHISHSAGPSLQNSPNSVYTVGVLAVFTYAEGFQERSARVYDRDEVTSIYRTRGLSASRKHGRFEWRRTGFGAGVYDCPAHGSDHAALDHAQVVADHRCQPRVVPQTVASHGPNLLSAKIHCIDD